MSSHLRFSGRPFAEQSAVLAGIVAGQPHLMAILEGMNRLDLPDPLLASGAIYNSVWNVLTGRDPLIGIKDADVAYFDASDLSYEAEDGVIRRAASLFAGLPIPVEVRNQARVHLWFGQKFGVAYPRLTCSADMLGQFASRSHAVAVRLEPSGALSVFAPFGLDDIFSFRVTPNPVLDNRRTHETKAARAKAIWPELTIVPWPDGPA